MITLEKLKSKVAKDNDTEEEKKNME